MSKQFDLMLNKWRGTVKLKDGKKVTSWKDVEELRQSHQPYMPILHMEFKGENMKEKDLEKEAVDHPIHYGGKDNQYEAIKVIQAWSLNFCLGNTIKYIARAGKKNSKTKLEDLKKALWYLNREVETIEQEENNK